ncbi:MAG: hypothetical protein IT549_11915 [Novosphingobium sp.]|nr:hypothetical protein [Novosphingobium sp.]
MATKLPKKSGSRMTVEQQHQIRSFIQLRAKFHRQWEKLGARDAAGQFEETTDDWLSRKAYQHLQRIVKDGRWPMLEHLVDYDRSLKRGRHSIKGKPFKVGLIAILGDKIKLGRNRRADLSDAMEYAYIHKVPARHFNGFVKQAGQKRIADKLKAGHVEPGFNSDNLRSRDFERGQTFPLITPD